MGEVREWSRGWLPARPGDNSGCGVGEVLGADVWEIDLVFANDLIPLVDFELVLAVTCCLHCWLPFDEYLGFVLEEVDLGVEGQGGVLEDRPEESAACKLCCVLVFGSITVDVKCSNSGSRSVDCDSFVFATIGVWINFDET